MKFDLLSKNNIAGSGFVAGLQYAALGNALSTAANLAELFVKTGVRTSYPFLRKTSAPLVAKRSDGRSLGENGAWGSEIDELYDITDDLEKRLELSGPDLGISHLLNFPENISTLSSVKDSIVVVSAEKLLKNMGCIERDISDFCSRGNGIFLHGAYWLQYGDEDERALNYLKGLERIETRPQAEKMRYKVAIHYRAGDYRAWAGGKFFFGPDVYSQLILRLQRRWPRAAFYLFSNEPEMNLQLDSQITTTNGSGEVEDFNSLSGCDLIVGPPSTFSTWAAFLGRSKRLVLTSDTVSQILLGENPARFAVDVERPTFSYVPGVVGPSTETSLS